MLKVPAFARRLPRAHRRTTNWLRLTPARRLGLVIVCGLFVTAVDQTTVWSTAVSLGKRTVERALGLGGAPMSPPPPSVTAMKTDSFPSGGDVDGDGKADPGDTIRYTVQISASGDAAEGVQFTDTPDANTTFVNGSIVISPIAVNESYTSVGNMTLASATIAADCATNALRSVTCNDTLNSGTLTGFGQSLGTANVTAPGGTVTTTNNGSVVLSSDGTFVYNPAAGFEGTDAFFYTLTRTSGTVTLTDTAQVSIVVGGGNGIAWFVGGSGSSGGTQSTPIGLAAFQAKNTLVSPGVLDPNDGDTVFLLEGAHTGPLTLRANQKLIGQDATATVAALGGAAPQAGNAYAVNGGGTVTISGGAIGVTLNSGNTIAGFTAGASTTTAITGGAVGALAVREVAIANPGGQGLAIATSATVTSDATFTGFTSVTAGGTNAIALTGVAGTLALGGGALSGATGATVTITNGAGSVTYNGSVSASAGTGLQFNNADGTYTFNGVLTLNGGDAGIDILSGSGGTFSFTSASNAITNPTGTAFNLSGSDANVTYNGSISDNSGFLIDIDNHDAGTITFQNGTLTSTGQGIRVQNSNGGTINVDNTTKNLNTGANAAVTLNTNNVGGTVNFRNGGLNIDTTSGAGFAATGGGTITVTTGGTPNTIDSTTGTPLNVAGTTIGAGGLTFQSISANGAANGIVLSATGTVGLTVTGTDGGDLGTDADAGTGGTLQNTTGDGVSLTSASNVSLGGVNVINAGGHGITMTGGSNLTLTTVQVTGAGNGDNEHGLRLLNASGTVSLQGSTFTDAEEDLINIDSNNNSSLTLNVGTVTACSFTHGAILGAFTGNGILLTGRGSSNYTVNVDDSTFTNIKLFGIQVGGDNTWTGTNTNVNLDNNDFLVTVTNTLGDPNNRANAINIQGRNTVDIDASITNNVLDGGGGGGIQFGADESSNVSANITGNTVSDQFADGILMAVDENASLTVLVNGNNISNTSSDGIEIANAISPDAMNGTLNATITNNTITNYNNDAGGNAFLAGITVFGGADAGDNTNIDIRNNTVSGNPNPLFYFDYYVDGTSFSDPIAVEGAGTGAVTEAQFLTPGALGNNSSAPAGSQTFLTGANFNNNTNVPLPVITPLTAAAGGVEAATMSRSAASRATSLEPSLEPRVSSPSVGVLTQAELDLLVPAARTRWDAAGLTAHQAAALRRLELKVQDLGGRSLGDSSRSPIVIGRTAGGYDWFIDRTPADDVEFTEAVSPTRLYTTPHEAPAGRVDLLTAVLHEMGHQLGLADSYESVDRDSLMFGHLTTGERRLPAAGQAAGATTMAFHVADPFDVLGLLRGPTRYGLPARAPRTARAGAEGPDTIATRGRSPGGGLMAALSSGLRSAIRIARDLAAGAWPVTLEAKQPPPVDVSLGNLPDGETVTVVFDVTVNGPNPVAQYSNQGTVTWTNSGSTLTDDPAAGGASDPTVTPGDKFNTATALVSALNPAFQGDAITFTATVTPTEGSGLTPDGTVQFKDGGSNLGSAVTCADAGSNTCSAQFTTSSLPTGTRSITAEYSGGTTHDPSTSDTVSQVVNSCTVNPVVTTNADGGAGSLRQALADACPASTITFSGVVSPIGLTSAELTLTRNVTISGPGANLLTVQRTSGTFRIFTVNAGVTAAIDGLTIAGGGPSPGVIRGGGISNNGGTLTVSNSALTGNAATEGGAIASLGDAAGSASTTVINSTLAGNNASVGGAIHNFASAGATSTLVIANSTISGNEAAANGGGVYNDAVSGSTAAATITSSTIANNRADSGGLGSGEGGGVWNFATTLLHNTIVATNVKGLGPSTTPDDFAGNLDSSSSHNFIGAGPNGGIPGVTNGSAGNIIGTVASPLDARLAALANNGGPVFTHALLAGSPALDAGDNALVVNPPFIGPPFTDQRGTGFTRIADAADADTTQTVDIGAFEADPAVASPGDQSMSEDGVFATSFNVGDAATPFDSVAATSSNPTIIPNVPGNLNVTGSGSTRTVNITPAPNQFGTATITLTATKTIGGTPLSMSDTFVMTVNAVPDAPSITNATTFINQQSTSGLVITPNAADNVEVTHFKITAITGGSLFLSDGMTAVADGAFISIAQGAAGLRFTPAVDSLVTGHFTAQGSTSASDAGVGGGTSTADITIVKNTTSTTITADTPDPSNRNITYPVAVTVASTSGGPTPTGSVDVSDGTNACTIASLDGLGQGTCSLTPATGAIYTITATYNGDTFSAPSSDTESHEVLNCPSNAIVTSTADSGAGSLRDAIANACATDSITFNIAGPGPHTIGLTSGELTLNNNLTITGPGAGVLTVQRTSGTFRIFTLTAGQTVSISGLTIANGDVTLASPNRGGAIYNNGAALTLTNIVLSGNAAEFGGAIFSNGEGAASASTTVLGSTIAANTANQGGAIFNQGIGGATGALTIANSTISGNTAEGDGGGLFNGGTISPVTVTNTTITSNRADDAGSGRTGGGIHATGGPVVLANTIVAGNVVGPSPSTTPDDIVGTVDASTNNLIGPADPILGPLASNGGPTPTHALLPGSPALDAGADAAAAAAGLTTDQRGFARLADGPDANTTDTVDIGAFEAQASLAVLANQIATEDGVAVTAFDVGDSDAITAVTATSNNPALVPNTPANLAITGSGATRTLTIVPAPNAFGTADITVTVTSGADSMSDTLTLTVAPAADTPSVTNAVTSEDTQTASGLVISRNAADGAEVTHFKITSITGGTLFQNDGLTPVAPGSFITFAQGNAGLKFTPALDSVATGHFTVQASLNASDAGLGGGSATADIVVTAVADTPSVTNATTDEDTQTTSGLVVSRNASDGAEITHFKITSITGGALFQNDGTTSIAGGSFITLAQATAGLKFTPAADSIATGHFTVQASTSAADAGLGGGTVTADITITPIGDAPDATSATTNEDTQTSSGLVLSRNAVDGAEVTHFKLSAIANGTLFKNDGTTAIADGTVITVAEGSAGLRFTPSANFHGTASFAAQAATSAAGAGTGDPTTVNVTVSPVADTPSVTNATTVVNAQTASGLTIARNAADGAEVTHVKITAITGGALFQNDGTTPIGNGTFITVAQGAAGLRFTPAVDSVATGHFTVQASLSAADAGLGGGTATADILVNRLTSATSLVTSATPVDPGQLVTFTATVTPAGAGADGTVQFKDGGTNLGTPVTLSSGIATFATTALTSGVHAITAEYSGNTLFEPSTGVLTGGQTIRTPTVTTLSSSSNPSTTGAAVTFTAVVAPTIGSGTPAGSVTFREGATTLSTVALSSGSASFTTSALTTGTHNLFADYGGDAAFVISTGALDQVVGCPTIAIAPASLPLAVVNNVFAPVTFTQAGGVGTVTFALTGALPAGMTFTASSATLAGTPTDTGSFPIAVTATDQNLCAGTRTYTLLVGGGRIITTGDATGGSRVRRFTASDGLPVPNPTADFFPFGPSFAGGVRVAEADLTGDGVADVIAGTGPGAVRQVLVYDGATGGLVSTTVLGGPFEMGGVFVAAGDVDGDGRPDLITSADDSPVVRVFSGASGAPLWSFLAAAPGFTGGVRVAAGDVNGDGYAEVITATGPAGGTIVKIFNGNTHAEIRSFAAYPGFVGGVFVAAGDVNGDGFADVITGAGDGGGTHVRVFDGPSGIEVAGFFATDPAFEGGVRVAAGDVNGDGRADVIAALGPGGGGVVRVFDALSGAPLTDPRTSPAPVAGGLFVGTASPLNRMVVDLPAAGAVVGPAFRLAGWAFEEDAPGTGIDAIHVWAYPAGGGSPAFAGAAMLGDLRPDVGAIFGARYANAGYHLDVSGFADGTYDLVVLARSATTGVFNLRRIVRVTIRTPARDVRVAIDLPTSPTRPAFRVAGWALDLTSTGGAGIDAVHVWALSEDATYTFLGAASLGDFRPDVAAYFGPAFANSGYHLDVAALAPGRYMLLVYARAAGLSGFTAVEVREITVATPIPTLQMAVDLPPAGMQSEATIRVAGWAFVQDGPTSGPGIDTIHVWAYPLGGGAPLFLGVPALGLARPDVASVYGAAYLLSGYNLDAGVLASGTWDIVLYVWPTGAGGFTETRTVRITVP